MLEIGFYVVCLQFKSYQVSKKFNEPSPKSAGAQYLVVECASFGGVFKNSKMILEVYLVLGNLDLTIPFKIFLSTLLLSMSAMLTGVFMELFSYKDFWKNVSGIGMLSCITHMGIVFLFFILCIWLKPDFSI